MKSSGGSQVGCLGLILKLFGFSSSRTTPENGPLPYRLRDDFLSPAERSFLGVLRTAVSSDHAICPKVNVADILYVARPNENLKYRNMIDRKHVDFLICDAATMRPLIAIELDDASHARSDRKDRDEFLDSAFKAASLPLLHVPAKQSYKTAELKSQIEQALMARAEDSATPTEPQSIPLCPKTGMLMDGYFQANADDAVVGDAYRRTARIISPDIARTYTMARAKRMPEAEDDFDDALIEAREDVAALHLMENLQVVFDAEAKKLSDAWFAKYNGKIKELPDDRQEAYRQIAALSTEPQDVDLVRPLSRYEPTKAREEDGLEADIATYMQHLLCDDEGLYPAELGDPEKKVLGAEMKRKGAKFWYRNPDRPSQDSLGIAYVEGEDAKVVRPDFIFFAEQDGKVVVDIIDPHGSFLADALPKLKGLAHYAESHSTVYRRIEAVDKVGVKLRVLDLTRADVRQAVIEATSAEALYRGAAAGDYA